ncbi:SDR family NAD(P)-dependent oxidoreductase [Komagataeibacter xylinus]|uniref:SDR family NAD(P)-dependent oxidoreductase n=1 Tax=Komagataeibacter xylinus TaxID=28448 RepID=UPI000FDF677D|nr:SDR family NAD(P)-dependent oxidoreductase [Komagataeibacter xylinus]AZV37599.1 short-chain dehydrogenase [Komagataeibacter xylinus]
MEEKTEMKKDHVVMISGANRGIGAALSARLQADGWSVSAGVHDPDALQLAAPHLVCPFDATRPKSEQEWVEKTYAHYGRIDAVIANAGVMTQGSFLDVEDEALEHMFQINILSPVRLVRTAWPHLVSSGAGRVVIVSSLSGKRVKSARSSAYAMTKHAAVALSHGIKRVGWGHGVRSTVVCPGFVATDMARGITGRDENSMTQAGDIAVLVSSILNMPNTANIAELCISCQEEDLY